MRGIQRKAAIPAGRLKHPDHFGHNSEQAANSKAESESEEELHVGKLFGRSPQDLWVFSKLISSTILCTCVHPCGVGGLSEKISYIYIYMGLCFFLPCQFFSLRGRWGLLGEPYPRTIPRTIPPISTPIHTPVFLIQNGRTADLASLLEGLS